MTSRDLTPCSPSSSYARTRMGIRLALCERRLVDRCAVVDLIADAIVKQQRAEAPR